MVVVIAGGTGYLGRALAAHWAARGAEVLVLSRGAAEVPGARILVWDGRSQGPWAASLDGADLVINLVGDRVAGASLSYRWTAERKALLVGGRRAAGTALVEAVRAASRPPSLFVQASGIDYYGPGEEPRREGDGPGRGFLSRLALEWEASTAPLEELGVRRLVLRLGPVLGPGCPVLGPLLLQHRLFLGGATGSGRQWFPWIALEDLVGGLSQLVDRTSVSGPCNFVAPGILRNAELSRALGRALHRPSWLPMPGPLLRLALGEMADTLLEGVRAEPTVLRASGYRFRLPGIDEALAAALRSPSPA